MSKRAYEDHQDKDFEILSGKTICCHESPCISNKIPIELYFEHVQQYHEHRCKACGGNFINERFLELHQDELHNPFRVGVSLRCFETSCTEEFDTQSQRIHHLHYEHDYPDSFDFNIINRGYTLE